MTDIDTAYEIAAQSQRLNSAALARTLTNNSSQAIEENLTNQVERMSALVGGGGIASVTANAPLTSTGGSDPVIAIPAATTTTPGHMTAEQAAALATAQTNIASNTASIAANTAAIATLNSGTAGGSGNGYSLSKRRAIYAALTQSNFASGNTDIRTTYGKVEVDAIPLRARVHIRSRGADITLAHWDFAVAMTEAITDASQTEMYSPLVGGVEYNSAPPAGYQYGWKIGNFTGGSTGTLHESTSDAPKITAACGPWVDLPYVPRADGKKGGVVLFRVCHNNTGSNHSIKNTAGLVGGDGSTYKSRKMWLRTTAGNGVTTLTSVPANTVLNDQWGIDAFLEFEFATPVRSIWVAGDSISANFEYGGWGMQAGWGLSTTERPAIPSLHALAGSTIQTFSELIQNQAAITGSYPTDLVIPCFSPNGVHSSDAAVTAAQATLTTVLNWAKTNGIRVFLWDGCPNNGYSATEQTRLNAMRTWAKARVTAGDAYKFVESARAVTQNYGTASGEKFTTGLNYDVTHPNEAGAARMAPLVGAALLLN